MVLSVREYAAPHLKARLPPGVPEDFVLRVRVFVGRFTGEAVVLAAAASPAGEVAVVLGRDGRVGIATGLFSPPQYGGRADVAGRWVDVYLRVGGGFAEVYVDGRRVARAEVAGMGSPMEVWLGALWLGGAGGYGAPIDIRYREVVVGKDGMLP